MKMLQWLTVPAVLVFIGSLIAAIGAIWAAGQQANSEQELRKKSEEIADLNRLIASSITGGDSFAYIVPTFFKNPEDLPALTIIHQGKYPLYDLTVRIVDLAKFEDMVTRDHSVNEMLENEIRFSVGNLAPNQASMLRRFPITGDSLRWNVFFTARNGFFTELLRVRRVDGEWKVALKVENTPTSEPVQTFLEKVDDGYPLDESGNVAW